MVKSKIIFGIFLLINCFLLSCSDNLIELTERYPNVYNTHNVEEIVALYADDAVFEIVGQFEIQGIDGIRGITKYDSVLNIYMGISNIEQNGDTILFNLAETNDWIKTSEIRVANYTVGFIFKDGLIKRLRGQAIPETLEDFRNVLLPLMTWAKEERKEFLLDMMPDGRFIYNAENANKTLSLLREWKESIK